ncbi:hypothetical protein I350_01535 [Cryptococcus amylolentus CBS 6273]|uniref:Uncharacterized protein n=1 Tax=Cryptococcus amylolentus CBS 6273 TaxID=1296118 RepID=A0A1E3KDA0_9TREE|nr:hypothetical protein I350_01535 [Cryptococcus amylolentus CBS 6273]
MASLLRSFRNSSASNTSPRSPSPPSSSHELSTEQRISADATRPPPFASPAGPLIPWISESPTYSTPQPRSARSRSRSREAILGSIIMAGATGFIDESHPHLVGRSQEGPAEPMDIPASRVHEPSAGPSRSMPGCSSRVENVPEQSPIPTYETALSQSLTSPVHDVVSQPVSQSWTEDLSWARDYSVSANGGRQRQDLDDYFGLAPDEVEEEEEFPDRGRSGYRNPHGDSAGATGRAPMPPAYSPEVGRDELQIVSSAHLSPDHPASGFFDAIATSPDGADPPPVVSPDDPGLTVGSKKLSVKIEGGSARRWNPNNTGPVYIEAGRKGKVKGTVYVGPVDHAHKLEVSILGFAKTSFYVRGQFSMIDTLPLVRSSLTLFPPARDSQDDSLKRAKDGTLLMEGKSEFPFEVEMPSGYWRDQTSELPPTCNIQQSGLQASVEYVIRIKLARKGQLRTNEEIGIPIIYQPRSYVPPRRLRLLSIADDRHNPGWRTIDLKGGNPVCPESLSAPISATLTLPSPFILFITPNQKLPTIPFHIHFHHPSGGLPLKVFSDPRESDWVIRLQRRVDVKVGGEKEVRYTELTCKVEVWEEGGEVIDLNALRNKKATEGSKPRRPSEDAESSANAQSKTESPRKKSLSLTDRLRRMSSTPAVATLSSSPTGISSIEEHPSVPSAPSSFNHEAMLGDGVQAHLATDITVHGRLDVQLPTTIATSDSMRKMVQSFNTPDFTVLYMMTVGIQPKKGAVKEYFGFMYGRAMVEVVWGR